MPCKTARSTDSEGYQVPQNTRGQTFAANALYGIGSAGPTGVHVTTGQSTDSTDSAGYHRMRDIGAVEPYYSAPVDDGGGIYDEPSLSHGIARQLSELSLRESHEQWTPSMTASSVALSAPAHADDGSDPLPAPSSVAGAIGGTSTVVADDLKHGAPPSALSDRRGSFYAGFRDGDAAQDEEMYGTPALAGTPAAGDVTTNPGNNPIMANPGDAVVTAPLAVHSYINVESDLVANTSLDAGEWMGEMDVHSPIMANPGGAAVTTPATKAVPGDDIAISMDGEAGETTKSVPDGARSSAQVWEDNYVLPTVQQSPTSHALSAPHSYINVESDLGPNGADASLAANTPSMARERKASVYDDFVEVAEEAEIETGEQRVAPEVFVESTKTLGRNGSVYDGFSSHDGEANPGDAAVTAPLAAHSYINVESNLVANTSLDAGEWMGDMDVHSPIMANPDVAANAPIMVKTDYAVASTPRPPYINVESDLGPNGAPATGRGGMAGDCAPDDAAGVYGMNCGSSGVGALADGFGALELPPVPAHLQVAGQPSTPPVRVAPTHVADESIYETPNDDVFHDFAYFWPSTQREQAEVLLPRVSALLPTPHVLQFDSGWPAGLVVRRIPPCMCVGGLTV